jgi:hypothetical protein
MLVIVPVKRSGEPRNGRRGGVINWAGAPDQRGSDPLHTADKIPYSEIVNITHAPSLVGP